MDTFIRDVRESARALMRQPAFTAVAVLILALGIGANAAIFTLVDAVMLRSLPVAKPHELYRLGDNNNCCVMNGFQGSFSLFSYPFYRYVREHTPEFRDVAAFEVQTTPLSVRREGASTPAEPYLGEFVSGNYFTMFGIRAAIGRTFTEEDDRPDSPAVTVMSYRTWRQHFQLDPAVVGATFTITGQPMTVVGIAPPGFFGETLRSDLPDFWLPLATEPLLRRTRSLLASTTQNWLYVIGRLRESAKPAQLQAGVPGARSVRAGVEARVTTLLQQWLVNDTSIPDQYRSRIPQQHVVVTPAGGGVAAMRARYADGLRVLSVVSALVLLIACANIANLLLARANLFQLAIRTALGAPRSRLIRQTLVDGVLLALAGGVAGLAVAYLVTRAILLLAFRGAASVPIEPTPSVSVLGAAFLLSLLTGILFSVGPAMITSRTIPLELLRGGGRSAAARSTLPRQALVVLQAALSLVLLVGAGLVTQSLRHLENQSFGFETDGRLIARVNPMLAGYATERLHGLYQQLLNRFGQLPQVKSVSLSLYSPMEGNNWSSDVSIEGRTSDPARPDSASWNRVGPRYFETIGTRVLRGRPIMEQDTPTAPRVAVVSDAFVRKFLPNQDPIGRHVGIGDVTHSGDFEIIGVVEDAKYLRAQEPPYPTIFLPLLQTVQYRDEASQSAHIRSTFIRDIELHVDGRPENLEGVVRRTLAEIDSNLTVVGVLTLGEQLGRNFNQQRLLARLTTLYAALALILASVGLYGVAAYIVTRRTSEIGVRMALGAGRARVVMVVLRGTLWQIAAGLLIGVPIALMAGRALSNQLYGISGHDPVVLNGAVLVLIASALIAAIVPARRAASIDPIQALRTE
jgi:predicted permease